MSAHALDLRDELDHFLGRLDFGQVVFFPVRHHSPACSWHLKALIKEIEPVAILVEGPSNFTPLIPHLIDVETEPPVSIYTTAVRSVKKSKGDGPIPYASRFGAYFPFCFYSPEYVALKAGHEIGAHLEFIDLTYAQQLAANQEEHQEITAQVENLMRDIHLERSVYLKALAQKCGCRNFHELWDHLFEARCFDLTPAQFRRIIAAYCFISRKHESEEKLAHDGTHAREFAMADAIRRVQSQFKSGQILVVTGGFHTVKLPFLLETQRASPEQVDSIKEELAPVLIRYTYPRLDALGGYASGMPSPAYYGEFWSRMGVNQAKAWQETSLEILAQIGQASRQKGAPSLLSTADVQVAWQHACGLASLRSHPGPLREDLRDGIRAAFIKGTQDIEGGAMMRWIDTFLIGTESGRVTSKAGIPPILVDFQRIAARHKLDLGGRKKELALDFYRKAEHRECSRFLHQLRFLEINFAQFTQGPDFASGTGGARLIEDWDYRWNPQSDSGVIDASLYGSSLAEAAGNKLKELAQNAVFNRESGVAVRLLISACQMGLHEQTEQLRLELLDLLAHEGVLLNAVDAAVQLQLLWNAREPLEASRLKDLPELFRTDLERCAYLVGELNDPGETAQRANARALIDLGDLFDQSDLPMAKETLINAMRQLLARGDSFPCLTGALLGILHRWNVLTEDEVIRIACGFLVASSENIQANLGVLEGLFLGSRHLAWQCQELLVRMNGLMGGWSDEEFLKLLPPLRLAFSVLTPREIGETSKAIAALHGEKSMGLLITRGGSEHDLLYHAEITGKVIQGLKQDLLTSFLNELEVIS